MSCISKRLDRLPAVSPYLIASACVAVALVARLLLDPFIGDRLPFGTFFIAVMATSWWTGLRPTLFALGLSSLLANVIFIQPRNMLGFLGLAEFLNWAIFFVVGLASALISEAYRVAHFRADASSRDAQSVVKQLEAEVNQHKITLEAFKNKELELQSFIENAITPIHLVDQSGIIVEANQAELDLLGYTREEYIGRPIAEFYTDQMIITDILQRLAQNEVIRGHEAQLRARDGAIKHVIINASPYRVNGRNTHSRWFNQDITERKAVEMIQSRLAAIVESSDDAIVSKTLDGTVVSWNVGAVRIFGYKQEEMIGKSIRSLFPQDRLSEEDDFLQRISRGQHIQNFETVRVRKDGQQIDISVTLSPIRDAAGTIVGISKIAHDITPRKREAQQRQLLLELSSAFSRAYTPEQIAEVVVQQGLKSLQAIVSTLGLLVEEGTMIELIDSQGISQTNVQQYRRTPVDFSGPLNDAVRTDQMVWIENQTEYVERYPHLKEIIQQNGSHSTVGMPLKIDEKILGGFILSFPFEKPRNPGEEIFFTTLAYLCAQALERSRLYTAEYEARELLQMRVWLQTVIAELGQAALTGNDLPALLDNVVRLLAQTMEVDYTAVLKLIPEENSFLLQAGVGWQDMLVGQEKFGAENNHPPSYTLQSRQPVIVEDFDRETRFNRSPLLRAHQVTSGLNVIIEGHEEPWGVLAIYTKENHIFTPDDVYFVQSVANILAAALERDRLDALLETEHQRLANILATVPGTIWENRHLNDQDEMELVFISGYVENMFGYTVEEALGDPHFWLKIFHPEDAEKTAQAFNQVRRSGGAGVVNFRAVHKKGHILNIQALMVTVLQDGKPVGKRGVMMDVSERQRLLDNQTRYSAKLRRSNEELQQFAYVAAHDLQEPLRMVVSYLQLIDSRYISSLDDTAREFMGFAVDGAVRMKEMLNALLTYARVDREEKPFEQCDGDAILNSALSNLALQIMESNAHITHDMMPIIHGDHVQITRVFQNLISNAIKFVRSGDTPKIHIGVERKAEAWQFCVRDNGIGIPPDSMDRIFIIFKRLHPRDEYPGSGIGLATCKKIIERHGGEMRVESKVGQGTTFYFTLPDVQH